MSLNLHSPAFTEGRPIPRRHTGDGDDVSPPLTWTTLPPGTVELVLIVDDPDAPSENPWVHWVLYNIPAGETTEGIPGGVPPVPAPAFPAGAVHGLNSWDAPGYRGPAPPEGHGVHHYHFKLYALGTRLGLEPGLDKHELMNAMSGHILGHGELVGTYQRPEWHRRARHRSPPGARPTRPRRLRPSPLIRVAWGGRRPLVAIKFTPALDTG